MLTDVNNGDVVVVTWMPSSLETVKATMENGFFNINLRDRTNSMDFHGRPHTTSHKDQIEFNKRCFI